MENFKQEGEMSWLGMPLHLTSYREFFDFLLSNTNENILEEFPEYRNDFQSLYNTFIRIRSLTNHILELRKCWNGFLRQSSNYERYYKKQWNVCYTIHKDKYYNILIQTNLYNNEELKYDNELKQYLYNKAVLFIHYASQFLQCLYHNSSIQMKIINKKGIYKLSCFIPIHIFYNENTNSVSYYDLTKTLEDIFKHYHEFKTTSHEKELMHRIFKLLYIRE